MNEIESVFVCIVLSLSAYVIIRLCRSKNDRRGLSGTDADNGSVRDLNNQAAEYNRDLAERERESERTIEQQAADLERANDDNRSARELIQRGKEILEKYDTNK